MGAPSLQLRGLPTPLWLSRTLFALCWLAFLAQGLGALWEDAQTSDEGVHLAAGVAQLRTGDLRMNPEHPPLSRLLAAAPVALSAATLPLEHPSWSAAQEWTFGARFLYRNVLPAQTLLRLGRLPIFLGGLTLLWLIYLEATRRYGPAGGALSGALAAACPQLLAHSHYITNDLLLALLWLATLLSGLRFRHSSRRGWLVTTGILCGLTLGTKFSGALILPCLLACLWPTLERDWRQKLVALLPRLGLVAVLSYLVLAGLYFGEPARAWLKGYFAMQSGWNSYLLGQVSRQGFYAYFPLAFLLKTPPASLILILAAGLGLRRNPWSFDEKLLFSSAVIFAVVSSSLRINIGIRHLLPVYPILYLMAGRLLKEGLPRLRQGLVWGLALCSSLECALAYPYHLSYFSALVGGPWQGWRYLSDSNLDWGQDMRRLAEYLRLEAPSGALLGTFSGADPQSLGLIYQSLPGFGALTAREHRLDPLPRRLVVVLSALNLQGVYFTQPGPFRTLQPLQPDLYHFLLERPCLARPTPSLFVWDITQDAEAQRRLAIVYANFGWNRSAAALLRRYLELRPGDTQAAGAAAALEAEVSRPTRPADSPSPQP